MLMNWSSRPNSSPNARRYVVRLLPRTSMTPIGALRMSWYSCALAPSTGPVNGVSGLAAESGVVLPYAPLRLAPSTFVLR